MMCEDFLNLRNGKLQVVVSVVLGCMIILPLKYEMYVALNTLIAATFGYFVIWECNYKSDDIDCGLYVAIFIYLACWFLPVWEDRVRLLWVISDLTAITILLKHRSRRMNDEC